VHLIYPTFNDEKMWDNVGNNPPRITVCLLHAVSSAGVFMSRMEQA